MGSTQSGRIARADATCGKTKTVQVEARATALCTRAVYRLERQYRCEDADGNPNAPTKSCHMLAPRTAYVENPA
jgi:hypothetical protein